VRFGLAGIVLLVPALAGARLWFVVQHARLYRARGRRIWRRDEGGAALYGGFLLCLAVSVPVLTLAELPFWAFWDVGSVAMLVGLIPTRVGCLMHGCCAGRDTAGPLGVRLPDQDGVWRRRYPTPLLEAAWSLGVLVSVFVVMPAPPAAGVRFAVLVAAYAAGRLVLEWTRSGARHGRSLLLNCTVSAALLAGAGVVLLLSASR
jgi:phosphatidylglycerol---prolipoprotein diacylglyceryl transferase